jgi:hypothetical protein
VAVGVLVAATSVAPAQTAGEPVSITLIVRPKVQTADFGKSVVLAGRITGSEALTAALADRRVELEVEAIAEGYERPVDVEPIVPKANGTFTRKYDIAVNSRITLRTQQNGAFVGASPTVRSLWRPLPEISNYTRGRKLVMEYRASVTGGIPFSRGSLKIRRGTATRAVFYAGPRNMAIPQVGKAKLKSAYDGEVHARLAIPFKDLPPAPNGGRIYACVKGTAFLGTLPVDSDCGIKRSKGHIDPPST